MRLSRELGEAVRKLLGKMGGDPSENNHEGTRRDLRSHTGDAPASYPEELVAIGYDGTISHCVQLVFDFKNKSYLHRI